MNRLFGKNNRKQLLTQHSLLDDNDDDDDVFSQVESALPQYVPSRASLLPDTPLNPVRSTDTEAVYPSSPSPKQKFRGGGIVRYQSAKHNTSSPTKHAPPISSLVLTKSASNPQASSPRRFSSPTKISMLQSFRDRIKFGTSNNECNEGSNDQSPNHADVTKTVTSKKYLEPPKNFFSSAEFSEPFATSEDDDENAKFVAPASEAFTVTCTLSSDEMVKMNNTSDDPSTQQPRPKLKFSISSEPLYPKAACSTPMRALNSLCDSSKEEKSNEMEIDVEESGGVSSTSNHTSAKHRVAKGTRQGRKKAIDKRPKTPTKEPTIDFFDTPNTPPADSMNKSELESIDNDDDDKKLLSATTPTSGSTKSMMKPPKETLPSEKDTVAYNNNMETLPIGQDEVDETTTSLNFPQKSKKDFAPQTPKRTYSSNDEAQFLVGDTTTTNAADFADDEKKTSESSGHQNASTLRPNISKKVSTTQVDSGTTEIATVEKKSKESKKSNTKTSFKNTAKDSKSKKKEKTSSIDKIATIKSPTKRELSTSKSKVKNQSTSNEKISSKTKQPKRRNSTNTIVALGDNDNDGSNNDSSISIIENKWLGIVDTKELNLTINNETMSKRRNSCTSIASSITMETMLPSPISASAVTLPSAFSKELDDDVPPWVKAAMHMIDQYQKNKNFVPPVDPITILPMPSDLVQPIRPIANLMTDPPNDSDTACEHIPSEASPHSAPHNTGSFIHAPKAPKRAKSFSSSSSSGSSSCSSCASHSDGKEERVEKSLRKLPVSKLEERVETSICKQKVGELIVAENLSKEMTEKGKIVADSQQKVSPHRMIATDQAVCIASEKEKIENIHQQIQPSVETAAPIISRKKTADQIGLEAMKRSVDLSLQSKPPQHGMTGPKISFHSPALYKRDITPSRGIQRRTSSGTCAKETIRSEERRVGKECRP